MLEDSISKRRGSSLTPQLEILVYLRNSRAFSNLLFEELEVLLEYLEVIEREEGQFEMAAGFSIVYEGSIVDQRTGLHLSAGSIIDHSDGTGSWAAGEPVKILFFSAALTNTLLRKEPELGLLLTDRLKSLQESGSVITMERPS